jgi:leader peptidase (prepilin peptidase)/N-methyltransferase
MYSFESPRIPAGARLGLAIGGWTQGARHPGPGFSSCMRPISARYPLTELAMAALFGATVVILGTDDGGELAVGIALCALLLVVTLTDLERRVIPNRVLMVGGAVAVAVAALADRSCLASRAIAAVAAGGLLLGVALAHPRGMGMGDVKLATVMGLFLGRAVAPALLIGFAAGAVFGLCMVARHGVSARKQAVPFGPFLAFGGVIGLWYGNEIVDWYLGTFF